MSSPEGEEQKFRVLEGGTEGSKGVLATFEMQ